MDYNQLYEQTNQKLSNYRSQVAVLEEKIKNLAAQLGLDMSTPLLPQVEDRKAELQKSQESMDKELQTLLSELSLLENEQH